MNYIFKKMKNVPIKMNTFLTVIALTAVWMALTSQVYAKEFDLQ